MAAPVDDLVAEDPAEVFARVRPRLFGIAYRMLGSAAEAEDIVQEVWLRWQGYDHASVRNPAAFLATTATRLAINSSQTARARRETYVGSWLPEPVDTSQDPALGAERGEALELALLLLLERLSPTERAAYVLREAFDYPYGQIAEIIGSSEVNTRQLVSRARKHLTDQRPVPVAPGEQRRLLDAFLVAAQAGDFDALEALFSEAVVSTSDGGGVARASRRPVVGRRQVARFVTSFAGFFWDGVELAWIEANGMPAVLITRGPDPVTMVTVAASDGGIDQVLWVMNPAKLSAVAPAA